MAKVFVSYSRRNPEVAKSLIQDMQALGHSVWYDQELSGGQAWWDKILTVILECDLFVFVLEEGGLNSTACRRELSYADALGKPVLPVLVSPAVSLNLLPPELERYQFVDYRNPDRGSAFALAKAMTALPAAGPLPNPLPERPEPPLSYLGALSRKVDAPGVLSYEEQTALVVDLKRGLRDPQGAADANALLRKLRSRRDLFAATAEEIDEVLGRTAQAAVPLPTPPTTAPARAPDQATPAPGVPEAPRPATPASQGRWISAFIGLTCGAAAGSAVIMGARNTSTTDYFAAALISGLATAIAGAIVGRDRPTFWTALGFYLVGTGIWSMVDSEPQWAFARGVVFGGPLSAVVGAVLGRTLARRRRAKLS